jgi:hypothetical protein
MKLIDLTSGQVQRQVVDEMCCFCDEFLATEGSVAGLATARWRVFESRIPSPTPLAWWSWSFLATGLSETDYSISTHGMTLAPVLQKICKWGRKH